MFWILEKRDDAIMGCVSGRQSQTVVDGPFDSYDSAWEVKRNYSSFGSFYYTITESDERPADVDNDYEFGDADREFGYE